MLKLAVSMMDEQQEVTNMGGTMRLGAYLCNLRKDSVHSASTEKSNFERHRHRYEAQPLILKRLKRQAFRLLGAPQVARAAEMVELPGHPYFVACQFHPDLSLDATAPIVREIHSSRCQ